MPLAIGDRIFIGQLSGLDAGVIRAEGTVKAAEIAKKEKEWKDYEYKTVMDTYYQINGKPA